MNNKDKFKDKEWTDNVHSIGANQTKAQEQTEYACSAHVPPRLDQSGQDDQADGRQSEERHRADGAGSGQPARLKRPTAAEPFEQKALQYLMRADALFTEIQVTQGGGGGGGGGDAERQRSCRSVRAGTRSEQEPVRNRAAWRNAAASSQDVDEALRKLKELAERQQKLQERRARQQQQGGGGGGGDQMTAQELQKETERLARQLDKLSRENNDRQMADAARALQQAAQNMQQQAQNGNASQQQQAAQQAQEQLQRAQRLLSQGRGGTMEERLAKAQEQAKKLTEQQRKIADETQQLAQNPGLRAIPPARSGHQSGERCRRV